MIRWLGDLLQPPKARSTGSVPRRRPGTLHDSEDMDVCYEEISFGEAIGAGSFGAVWRGVCRGMEVAIKQCKVGEPKEAEMLLLEMRYLQKLRHPSLVSFLGCCNRAPHVVMMVEYMPGGSLHALLFGAGGAAEPRRPLSFSMKAGMALQVAEGLAYLHDLSVIHRDMKSMNIVLDRELNCKICDFGLTLTLERSHVTVKSLQGSPRYMAPEQFETTARITEKVDIWQMGCVMLELFCQSVPFAGALGVQQIAAELLVRKRPPRVPSDGADSRARVLIEACLRIDSRQRPEAATLEDAIRATFEAEKRAEAAAEP